MQAFIVSNLDLKNGKLRLDSYLSAQLACSKNQIHHLIKAQLVSINGVPCHKNGIYLKASDSISIHLNTDGVDSINAANSTDSIHTESKALQAIMQHDARFKIDILHQDEHILIINKPAHLIIHKAPSVKEPTLTDWLKSQSHILHTLSGEERYGIVHRLDKQTSGALAIAKSHLAYAALPKELKSREMGRYYLAIIDMPLQKNQQVSCYMGRAAHNRLKMSKIHIANNAPIPKGVRDSKSSFVKLATSNNGALELIAIKLHTGRTHQIRAHLESLSRHILGDTLYGYKISPKTHNYQDRILLHAYILYLIHPQTQQKCTFKAPIALDMLEFIQTHFTKDLPDGCEDIMELLEVDRIMGLFECFS